MKEGRKEGSELRPTRQEKKNQKHQKGQERNTVDMKYGHVWVVLENVPMGQGQKRGRSGPFYRAEGISLAVWCPGGAKCHAMRCKKKTGEKRFLKNTKNYTIK